MEKSHAHYPARAAGHRRPCRVSATSWKRQRTQLQTAPTTPHDTRRKQLPADHKTCPGKALTAAGVVAALCASRRTTFGKGTYMPVAREKGAPGGGNVIGEAGSRVRSEACVIVQALRS
mmetsp:Transcript_3831/g.9683  ORF Transcript_3831/g.9683 Transcript_3831/m.9683 type:complete len:119 (-) Transcript_3831:781-1137(-)